MMNKTRKKVRWKKRTHRDIEADVGVEDAVGRELVPEDRHACFEFFFKIESVYLFYEFSGFSRVQLGGEDELYISLDVHIPLPRSDAATSIGISRCALSRSCSDRRGREARAAGESSASWAALSAAVSCVVVGGWRWVSGGL